MRRYGDKILICLKQAIIYIMFKTGHYDCVGERDIHHDLSDTDRATVYDKSKPYQVAILARGEFALLAVLFEIKKLILKTI